VSQFKYPGNIISYTTNDDDDLRSETKKLLLRTNALISKFYRCCINVKLVLFKTFCLCVCISTVTHMFVCFYVHLYVFLKT